VSHFFLVFVVDFFIPTSFIVFETSPKILIVLVPISDFLPPLKGAFFPPARKLVACVHPFGVVFNRCRFPFFKRESSIEEYASPIFARFRAGQRICIVLFHDSSVF